MGKRFKDFYEENSITLSGNNLRQQIDNIAMAFSVLYGTVSEEEKEELYQWELERSNVQSEDGIIIKSKFSPWFDDYYNQYKNDRKDITFFERYKEQIRKKFPRATVQKIEYDMKKVLELAGDVTCNKAFSRKGMVVGDVQSGKTSNYTGLINLGVDVGYNVIIVLAGLTNQLRAQTQSRVEEGVPSDKKYKELNKINKNLETKYENLDWPKYLSSVNADFNANSKEVMANYGTNINKDTHIIVTKKNTKTLQNIYDWLKDQNVEQSSLLLIDDEADSASINTNKEDENPTIINGKIRDILNLFHQNSYVGFTATPFANVFIDKEAMDDNKGSDIFPKDYIYILGESSNYIGVDALFSDDSEYKQTIVTLNSENLENFLPLKHSKQTEISFELPQDLIDAINSFLISNTLLDMDHKLNGSRTMMVNMSRFNEVQERLADVVEDYYKKIKQELSIGQEDEGMRSLKSTYERLYNYNNDNLTFDDIKAHLFDSIKNIEVRVVNQESNDLDYSSPKRVIVIGGLSLARGLTLEGLIVSFYWRTTNTYDGLLQAGRWFGYRSNYIDYCRIFLSPEKIDDYQFISEATKELKVELKDNYERNTTPEDFAIKIRSGKPGLIITAQNKMRGATSKIDKMFYNYEVVESVQFDYSDSDMLNYNKELFNKFIEKHQDLISNDFNPNSKKIIYGLKNVSKEDIINLLREYQCLQGNPLDASDMTTWLGKDNDKRLDHWDVIFIEGDSDTKYQYNDKIQGMCSKRTMIRLDDEPSIIRCNSSRLASPNDGRLGLTLSDYEQVKIEEDNKNKAIAQKSYLSKKYNHKPTILVYHVVPNIKGEIQKDQSLIALSIEIPELKDTTMQYQEYKYNE